MTRRRRPVDPSPWARWRRGAFALLRSVLAVALLVVAYYRAPLDATLDAGGWVVFGAGLLGFAGCTAWQVHAILRSDTPRLQAAQTVVVGIPLLLLLFAVTYALIATNQPDAFSEPMTRTDALYFTVTVFATVGFGDIAPTSEVARIVTMVQMLLGLIAVGVLAKVLLGAVRVSVRRREGSDDDRPD
jgi:voltage-gated potassium channel